MVTSFNCCQVDGKNLFVRVCVIGDEDKKVIWVVDGDDESFNVVFTRILGLSLFSTHEKGSLKLVMLLMDESTKEINDISFGKLSDAQADQCMSYLNKY